MDKYDELLAYLVKARQVPLDVIRTMIQASFQMLPSLEGLPWGDIREKLETAHKDESDPIMDDGLLDMWTFFIKRLLEIPKDEREIAKQETLANYEQAT